MGKTQVPPVQQVDREEGGLRDIHYHFTSDRIRIYANSDHNRWPGHIDINRIRAGDTQVSCYFSPVENDFVIHGNHHVVPAKPIMQRDM
jgi:hypothetical protein